MPCFCCILERDNHLRKAATKIRDAVADGVRSEHELGQKTGWNYMQRECQKFQNV